MRAVKSVSIESDNRVAVTYLGGSTEILFPGHIDYDEAISLLNEQVGELNDDVGELKENISNFNDLGLSVVDGAINITYEETSV